MTSNLLTPKELAAMLKRHTHYVYAMRRLGFPMPGGRSTIDRALAWLELHPSPRSKRFTKGHKR